jgi:hypothetical protein
LIGSKKLHACRTNWTLLHERISMDGSDMNRS